MWGRGVGWVGSVWDATRTDLIPADMGSVWDRVGSVWDRYGINMASIWDWYGIGMGLARSQSGLEAGARVSPEEMHHAQRAIVTFQKRTVSSAEAVTTVWPSGDCAMWRIRAVWPVSSATLTMEG